ncbi:DUF3788 domain-containing protein [Flavobacterium sp. SM15]|uniref:DUF3788 domain-containing protein n=1 Tax=Flavobacterium sp. SM15 TaxID=2908005 RepID=UPI001EDB9381|nr:DUF3788 domain-containing protein [Flavobacterium sp. SM15]MCG2611381.1 DUF3788 domain-containing protein [Flavobacterium sp. SM15]
MKSIFTNKTTTPTPTALEQALANTFPLWQTFETFAKEQYPAATVEWHYSGDKFGWSYRIKDKKRVLLYLLPRDRFFKTAFVFGEKATARIMESDISETIKKELMLAKPYAEGRGIRIEIKDTSLVADIQKLITIKIAN